MKLAVPTCAPGPGRLGPMCALPSTDLSASSTATIVQPGGCSSHISRAARSLRSAGNV